MIFDQFGKPVRAGNTFCTPEWLMRESGRLADDWEADRRLRELRNSLAFAEAAAGSIVGNTIKVRLPKRFASADPVCDTKSTE